MNDFTRMPEPTFTVQEWLAHRIVPTLNNKPLRYAMWWIDKQMVSPKDRLRSLDFDGGHRLYVTCDSVRYQVLSVNRFSEVCMVSLSDEPTLAGVVDLKMVYRRLNETDFTEWSNTPEGPLNESKFVPYINSARDHQT